MASKRLLAIWITERADGLDWHIGDGTRTEAVKLARRFTASKVAQQRWRAMRFVRATPNGRPDSNG